MLRIHQSRSIAAAKSYFVEGLERGDYYTGQELPGIWQGKAATMLGLEGEVQAADFHALCDNVRPDTGGKLNPRVDKDRKVGYDFTFSAPKSVSILHGVVGDERILEAFQTAVRETMERIEADAHVRVRKGGKVEDRKTGNLVWGEFTHFTSRPVNGISDPQLHAHCYTFNTSYDPVEQRFKAGEFYHIKHDAPYYEAIFHSKLADQLKRLGYPIENRPFSFEILGVGQDNINRFSRRSQEIESLAEELGIADNDRAKDGLAAKTRASKSQPLTKEAMLAEWQNRLDWTQLATHLPSPAANEPMSAKRAVELAIADSFERKSVAQHRRIIARALQHSLGETVVEAVEPAMEARDDLVVHTRRGIRYATTRDVIAEEVEILKFLEATQSNSRALNASYQIDNVMLDDDQRAAVTSLLASKDRVFVIEGRAGTGKTTLMTEAIKGIEAGGTPVFTFAPTSEAAHHVLKAEGFAQSDTVQQLLVNPALQEQVTGAVIWVDEAGLLSSKDLLGLVRIAKAQHARLVLSGDTRQHHSVTRGDALRLLVQSGLVEVVATEQIHRQQPEHYRRAVEELSRGEVGNGFQILDELGAIKEVPDLGTRLKALVTDYVQSLDHYSNVLVVSPTHQEADLVTEAIRARLKESGTIKGKEHVLKICRNRNLTVAERQLPHFLRDGDVVRFHKSVGGFAKDLEYEVHRDFEHKLMLRDPSGHHHALPFAHAQDWQVYRREAIPLAVGDRIRLTENTTAQDGTRLYNGSVHHVVGFTEAGDLVLSNHHILPHGHAMFQYGYVTTSHASQGKTSGKVIMSESSMSSPAASLEQFYVSASRGKSAISIYTDDRQELLEMAQKSSQRMLATELAPMRRPETNPLAAAVERTRHFKPIWERLKDALAKQANAIADQVRQHLRQSSITRGMMR